MLYLFTPAIDLEIPKVEPTCKIVGIWETIGFNIVGNMAVVNSLDRLKICGYLLLAYLRDQQYQFIAWSLYKQGQVCIVAGPQRMLKGRLADWFGILARKTLLKLLRCGYS